MDEPRHHEPIGETFPPKIRAQLEQMRELARPHLDAVDAEFHAHPKVPLDRLPAVRAARAVDDEETRVALLTAVMERHLDTSHEMWSRLTSMLYGPLLRSDPEMPQWLQDHPVVSRLWEAEAERTKETLEASRERRAEEKAAGRTRPCRRTSKSVSSDIGRPPSRG